MSQTHLHIAVKTMYIVNEFAKKCKILKPSCKSKGRRDDPAMYYDEENRKLVKKFNGDGKHRKIEQWYNTIGVTGCEYYPFVKLFGEEYEEDGKFFERHPSIEKIPYVQLKTLYAFDHDNLYLFNGEVYLSKEEVLNAIFGYYREQLKIEMINNDGE